MAPILHVESPRRLLVPTRDDLVVVDLRDPVEMEWALRSVLSKRPHGCALMLGEEPIPPTWVELIAEGALVIRAGCSAVSGVPGELAQFIESGALQLRLSSVALGCLRRAPRLTALSDVVMVVLESPWNVRRPRDLARALRTTIDDLKGRSVAAGFQRLEHVIALTRATAYRCLVDDIRLRPATAYGVLGIRDRSNFRRQLSRTMKGSNLGRQEECGSYPTGAFSYSGEAPGVGRS
jgi:hypothetical protein